LPDDPSDSFIEDSLWRVPGRLPLGVMMGMGGEKKRPGGQMIFSMIAFDSFTKQTP